MHNMDAASLIVLHDHVRKLDNLVTASFYGYETGMRRSNQTACGDVAYKRARVVPKAVGAHRGF